MKHLRLILALGVLLCGAAPASANRLFTSGFELQNTTNGVEWYTSDTPPAVGTIETSTVRSGAAALRIPSLTTLTAKGQVVRFTSSASNGVDYILRVYMWVNSYPNVTTGFMGFGDAAVANKVRASMTTTGTVTVFVDTAETVGTTTTACALAAWCRLELRFNRGGVGTDQVELKIGGVTEVNTSAANISALPTRVMVGGNLSTSPDATTTFDAIFDDVALNDSNGSAQTSWPGEGSVVMLTPNGTGEFDGTTLGGSSAAATAWQSLDDGILTGTVDGVDFVTFDANTTVWTSGDRLAVAMSSLPTADSVAVVQLGVYLTNTGTLNSQYSIGVQTSNGGTRTTATPASWNNNSTYALNYPTTIRSVPAATLYADPDSAAWTQTTVNAMQVLLRSDDGSPSINVTSVWATVEYTPGVGAPPAPKNILLLGVGS